MSNTAQKSESSKMQSIFWNSEKKKPSKHLFIILIAICTIILIWGIYDLIATTHEIRIVIDYSGSYDVEIAIGPSFEYIEGSGNSEFTYRLGEDSMIQVNIFRSDWDEGTMAAYIYDDGKLVREWTTTGSGDSIFLEYTVGE